MGSSAATGHLFLTILILTVAAAAATIKPVKPASPFCTSTIITAHDDKVLCTKLVKNAKTWPRAMTNAIKGVLRIVNSSRPRAVDNLGALLPRGMAVEQKQSASSLCRRMFDFYVGSLKHCIKLVRKNDDSETSNLKTYLSSTVFSSCSDSLSEWQISVPEVDRLNDRINELGDILLAILDKKPQNQ